MTSNEPTSGASTSGEGRDVPVEESGEGGIGAGDRIDDRAASAAEKWGTGASGDITLDQERPHAEEGAYGTDRGMDEGLDEARES